LEQTVHPGKDDASISELKRVLLNRIADLELSKTFYAQDDEIDEAPDPAELISPPSTTKEGTPEKDIDNTPLDKLD
jgi:hypothetical protein